MNNNINYLNKSHIPIVKNLDKTSFANSSSKEKNELFYPNNGLELFHINFFILIK